MFLFLINEFIICVDWAVVQSVGIGIWYTAFSGNSAVQDIGNLLMNLHIITREIKDLKDPIMGVSTSLLTCIFVFLIIGMILGFLQGRKQKREDFSSSINDGNENLLNTNIISQNSLQGADLSDVEEENNSATDEI